MIPYLLAAVGGYLIGESRKGQSFAKGGMMAKGGWIDPNEFKEFVDYAYDYYGPSGLFSEFFPPKGLSKKQIAEGAKIYVNWAQTKEDQWGGGDTIDREIVRDILLAQRGTKMSDLEFEKQAKAAIKYDKK